MPASSKPPNRQENPTRRRNVGTGLIRLAVIVNEQCAEPPFTVKCRLLQFPKPGRYNRTRWAEPSPDTRPSEKPSEPRLDSWKEIAAYLGRDVTTVQRWEKRESMPVHRHVHDKRGSVYALAPELDAWLKSRRQQLADDQDEKEPEPEAPVDVQPDHGPGAPLRARGWLALAAVAVLGLLAAAYIMSRGRPGTRRNPKSGLWQYFP